MSFLSNFSRRLKAHIRSWLMEPDEPDESDPSLKIQLDGQEFTAIPSQAIGLRLQCSIPAPGGMRVQLLGESQCVDRAKFWKAWKSLGGKAVWEDGSAFEPPENAQ